MYCKKHVIICLALDVTKRTATHHGSRASRLEMTNTPYVASSDTTMREKMGEPMFLTACIMQRTPQINMLEALANTNRATHYKVRMAKM